MSVLDNDNESPTVRKMKRELDALREREAKMAALLLHVYEKYQQGREPDDRLAARVTMITGRV